MKSKEFGAWLWRNVTKNGRRKSEDEYNKSFKGQAYQHVDEYASRNVNEYNSYPETKDMSADRDDQKKNNAQAKAKERQKNNARKKQNLIGRAVALSVGAVLITTSYNSAIERQKQTQPTDIPVIETTTTESGQSGQSGSEQSNPSATGQTLPSETSQITSTESTQISTTETVQSATTESTLSTATETVQSATTESALSTTTGSVQSATTESTPDTTTEYKQSTTTEYQQTTSTGYTQTTVTEPAGFAISWAWSDDNQTAALTITDSNGRVISEISAVVSVSSKDATCTKEGSKTYTATAEYDGDTYSDSKTETLKALGHSFDNGKEIILDDGRTAMEFECTRCHEHFTIVNSYTEVD